MKCTPCHVIYINGLLTLNTLYLNMTQGVFKRAFSVIAFKACTYYFSYMRFFSVTDMMDWWEWECNLCNGVRIVRFQSMLHFMTVYYWFVHNTVTKLFIICQKNKKQMKLTAFIHLPLYQRLSCAFKHHCITFVYRYHVHPMLYLKMFNNL